MLIVSLGEEVLLGFNPLFGALGSTGVAESTVTGKADSLGVGAAEVFTAESGKPQDGGSTGEHSTNVVDNDFANSVFVIVEVTPPQVSGAQEFFEW